MLRRAPSDASESLVRCRCPSCTGAVFASGSDVEVASDPPTIVEGNSAGEVGGELIEVIYFPSPSCESMRTP